MLAPNGRNELVLAAIVDRISARERVVHRPLHQQPDIFEPPGRKGQDGRSFEMVRPDELRPRVPSWIALELDRTEHQNELPRLASSGDHLVEHGSVAIRADEPDGAERFDVRSWKRLQEGRDVNSEKARTVAEKGEIGGRQPLRTPDLLEHDIGLDAARPLMLALLVDVMRATEDECGQYRDRNKFARHSLDRMAQRPFFDRLDRALQHG
ncbi:hypothetical protein C7U92_11765 [Bradyrhizobium sp. WBOS7]|uniref:Uncharacterized protein n=1 Tax=Bradyrhizobium betae TaxID=244734 RepID=A0AAE9N9C9_9BRAD|nr:hypothetical protein [Bradyrhizobium sp. WBOS7]UUO34195.1 hypothetical protein DCK84_06145 [Bradyrhizobium sp. WBOS01]UUO40627.1 hypothetical protein DCM75_07570 [Bradyrhizobium sp. WBOS02]UUO64895.1 hypothetical protein DCM83_06465 [Bradyrhizobium betae]